ncbi:hypothetical protein [uncultured Roseobacter sp.]|uniref:hypothetical protein n=1 Tax=uncultured Roseobacter sp. TaxID=114847 RepID=UPI0026128B81|nr:hypothetical protein [uncultured Roseobacter sp.]
MSGADVARIYIGGLTELFLSALGWTVVIMLPLHKLTVAGNIGLDTGAAFLLIFSSIVLMALWPGQTFWTIRRKTAAGFEHSVIGAPSDDDEAARIRLMVRHLTGGSGS